MTTGFLDARVCVVSLGGELFAFDVSRAHEVVFFEDFTPVPLAPAHVVGVANLRGEVMPIVDARPLLGVPATRAGRRHQTLVIAGEGLEAALVIDSMVSLEGVGEIVPVEDEAAAAAAHAEWAVGFLRRDDRLVPVLDVARILNALRPAARSAA